MKKAILILAVAGGLSLVSCDSKKGTETATDNTTMEDNTIDDNSEMNDMDTAEVGTTMDSTNNDVGM